MPHLALRVLARLSLVVVVLLVPLASAAPHPSPARAQTPAGALEEPIVGPDGTVIGRHFRQTGDGSTVGFDVRAPFLQPFLDLGGGAGAGYPISVPFLGADACAYQAFQVVLFQRCDDSGVKLANTFEILHEAGADPQLESLGIGPGETDTSASFPEALQARRAWLEDAAIRDRFLGQCGGGDYAAAVEFCGLPMNRPRAAGAYITQRFQRIAFQRWLEDGPGGIRAGAVTTILGGDLLKQTGVLIGVAVQPHVAGRPPAPPPVRFSRPEPPPPAPSTVAVTGATLSPGRRTTPLAYGFQADLLTPERRRLGIARTQEAGFGWIKQQVVWANFEMTAEQCRRQAQNCLETTVNGNPKYFWRNQLQDLETVLNDILAGGLNVLISIVRAPDFYAAPQGVAPADPTKLRDFLQFLTSYPPYKGKINAVEPWNEQNLSWEWGGARLWSNAPNAPPQGVVDFLQLQKQAYQGVKAGDAGVTVVLPALTPTGVGECWRNPDLRAQRFCLDGMRLAIDDVLYLEFLYSLNNGEIKQYYDVLGVHPSGYNNPPDDFLDRNTLPASNPASGRYKGHGSFYLKRYRQLREVQERAGDTKPVWITEMGWSSTRRPVPGYEFGIDNTEEQRGKYVARMLEVLNAEAPFVTQVFIWNLNWRTFVPEQDERYGFGILDASGAPLPAFTCAADYVRSGARTTRPECRL